jgi:hypothetical protein
MARPSVHPGSGPRHVSLVARPDAVVATLSGIFEVRRAFALMGLPNARRALSGENGSVEPNA